MHSRQARGEVVGKFKAGLGYEISSSAHSITANLLRHGGLLDSTGWAVRLIIREATKRCGGAAVIHSSAQKSLLTIWRGKKPIRSCV